jgi:NADPH:quinone reductase-like Zn-dependent oxidoreductase/acyl carrier protein
VEVDWPRVFEGSGAKRVELPTYAFQHKRYWMASAGNGGDPTAVGQSAARHPLLGAATSLAGDRGWLFTGRLSLQTHPWLADHAVMGSVLLAGAAFVDLALQAGREAGYDELVELVLQSPLTFAPEGGVQLQVVVEESDASGYGSIGIYSRAEEPAAEDAAAEGVWVCHATGRLAGRPAEDDGAGESEDADWDLAVAERVALLGSNTWPPPGGEPLAVEDLYDRMASFGYEYGPVFQGVEAAWRRGAEIFAEVSLSEDECDRAASFCIHPALLDAALQAAVLAMLDERSATGEGVEEGPRLPFSWNGVRAGADGATRLRVHLCPAGEDALSIVTVDDTGSPAASVRALVSRPISAAQLGAAQGEHESLFRLAWTPIAGGGEVEGATANGSGRSLRCVVLGEGHNGVAGEGHKGVAGEGHKGVAGEGHKGVAGEGHSRLVGEENGRPAGEEHGRPAGEEYGRPAGEKHGRLVAELGAAGAEADVFADLDRLAAALEQGFELPATVFVDCTPAHEPASRSGSTAKAAQACARLALGLLQGWLADERFSTARLVLVTRGAVAAGPGEAVGDLAGAPLWGMTRSAQSEHPGRFALLDLDEHHGEGCEQDWRAAIGALSLDEPQLAVRGGQVLAPRLARLDAQESLAPPVGTAHWRLRAGTAGTLESLALAECPEAGAPLAEGQIRLGVRAAGLNFADVLVSLSTDVVESELGYEGAGVVLEVGPGVEDLAVGDRVMGVLRGGFGPSVAVDRRLVAPMPAAWSFVEAASVPIVFLTAYYALVDLARLQPGEKLLVHAAAGGVGMAAVQLARHLGAEVFATASPAKWEVLSALGLDESHIASSRSLEFKDKFMQLSGEGMDVVLNSLAREFIDASLQLLPRGGRFVEMGKLEIRDSQVVADAHPGVAYRAFDLLDAGPERIQEMFGEVLGLFAQGTLELLPRTTWDLRRAPEAFRFLGQGRHVGKNVLTVPQPLQRQGTALITGGTGGLGALVARHLVTRHGLRSLLLASRRGEHAEGAQELASELRAQGARVQIVACDVADRAQLEALLGQVPAELPLTAVVHAAGVLDDGVLESLTPERVERVLAPKVDAAWHLHELTIGIDLAAFVLFSAGAGTLGSPGQSAYAAANVFLDSLAAHRRALGLPGLALAWGQWALGTDMVARLEERDRTRLTRMGMRAFSAEEGLELFDTALMVDEPLLIPMRLDAATLRSQARLARSVPPMLRGLIRMPASRARREGGESLARRLAGVPAEQREGLVLELVRGHVAELLGHPSPRAVGEHQPFKELGVDSLGALELRSRLSAATGIGLPATLVFDCPTPAAVADLLLASVAEAPTKAPMEAELDRLERALTGMAAADEEQRTRVAERLRGLLGALGGVPQEDGEGVAVAERLGSASADEVFDFIDTELGS